MALWKRAGRYYLDFTGPDGSRWYKIPDSSAQGVLISALQGRVRC